MRRRSLSLSRRFNQELVIGAIAHDVRHSLSQQINPDIIAPEAARKRHMHVIGSNGSDKSRFLRSLIQQDIREGRGVCLIDPHGTLCTDVLRWLANRPRLAKYRSVRYFPLGSGGETIALNPLEISEPLHAHAVATRVADALGSVDIHLELMMAAQR